MLHHMSVIDHYEVSGRFRMEFPVFRDILSPTWADVETAIRGLDNDKFSVLSLFRSKSEPNVGPLFVVGGRGLFAMRNMMGQWQYSDPHGGDDDFKFPSGYYCKERNILRDIERVLRITKVFYETGSYEKCDQIS